MTTLEAMDLHVIGPLASPAERAAVDAVLGPAESAWRGGDRNPMAEGHVARGGHAARSQRDLLIPTLHAVQSRIGWISQPALSYVCRRLTVPPAEAYGVATFYALFSTTPRPPTVAHLCDDIACALAGAEDVAADLERALGPAGTPSSDGQATWLRSPCLGLCERAPAAMFTIAGSQPRTQVAAPVDAAGVAGRLSGSIRADATDGISAEQDKSAELATGVPQAGQPGLRLLARVGVVDPTSLDDYRAHGGFARARARAAGRPRPGDRRSHEVRARRPRRRRLPDRAQVGRGRGPAGTAPLPRVQRRRVRAGTFKDRVLMEHDPFAVVEAMAIEAFAVGAREGVPLHPRRVPAGRGPASTTPSRRRATAGLLRRARHRAAARRRGLHLRRGDGPLRIDRGQARRAPQQAAVPGRGRPVRQADGRQQRRNARQRPPDRRPRTAAPMRSRRSAPTARPARSSSASAATSRTAGRLRGRVRGHAAASCSSWPVACPAAAELKAVLLGGAAGVFVGPDALDTPLTFEATRAIGATLGSGVVMAFDETADLVGTLRRIAQFFRDESCGQCVPCRVGTVRQEELLARLAAAQPASATGTRSSRCSARSARRCAMPASAASARRPARRSRAPCAGRSWWPCERPLAAADSRPAGSADPAGSAGPTEPARRSPRPEAAARRSSSRSTGSAVTVPAGSTILEACRAAGDRHADPLLPREPDAGQRLPRLRRRGDRIAGARARVLAQGRSRDGRPDRHRARPPQPEDGPRVPRLVGRPVDGAVDRRSTCERYGADPTRYGPTRPRPRRPASGTPHEAGHHHVPAGEAPSGRDRPPAGEGRQRPLRP